MTAQDERILNECRRHFDSPYDVRPVRSASIADLDLVRFERDYLPAVVAPDVLAANERTPEQRLASTKMIATVDDPVPTVVGLIVIGRDPRRALPGHYVQFLRVQGTTLGEAVVDELLIDGALTELVRRLDDKLQSHNREAVRYRVGPVEHRTALYPVPALQQLTRNALLHRTFESTNAPVRVYWFDDRLEVSSPGGPFGQVTIENTVNRTWPTTAIRISPRACGRSDWCRSSAVASRSRARPSVTTAILRRSSTSRRPRFW